jgi:hypothetical protein
MPAKAGIQMAFAATWIPACERVKELALSLGL